jgi:hypothetical protein
MRFNFEVDPEGKCLVETKFDEGRPSAVIWYGRPTFELRYSSDCEFPKALKEVGEARRDEYLARLVIAHFKSFPIPRGQNFDVEGSLQNRPWQGGLTPTP